MNFQHWLRGIALLGIVVVAAGFALACGSDDDDNGDDGGGQPGGSLTIQYYEFDQFDPHASAFGQDLGHFAMVWRGLYKLDYENMPQPEMAAEIPEISDDGLVYTVSLKPGLVWSDGDPLDAADFVAGIQRSCSPDVAGAYQYLLASVAGCDDYYFAQEATGEEKAVLLSALGVRALDDLTVEFTLISPQPTFVYALSLPVAYPVPTHLVVEPGAEWPGPGGLAYNGPFVVESYTAGDRMVLVRNESFAGANPAKLDTLTLRYIDDATTSTNAFASGELDLSVADLATLDSVREQFGSRLIEGAPAGSVAVFLQMGVEPLSDYRVRLALSRSIDRAELTSVVLQDAAVATTTWTPPEVAGVEADFSTQIGLDRDAAREALADAGYPEGEGFPELTVMVVDDAAQRATAEYLQETWRRELGIEVAIETIDSATWGERLTSLDYEVTLAGWGQDFPDPENWLLGLFQTDGPTNFTGCSDARLDELISAAQFNQDDAERRGQYREANEIVSTGMCGVIPLFFDRNYYLVSDRVGGAAENASTQDRVVAGDWNAEDWSVVG